MVTEARGIEDDDDYCHNLKVEVRTFSPRRRGFEPLHLYKSMFTKVFAISNRYIWDSEALQVAVGRMAGGKYLPRRDGTGFGTFLPRRKEVSGRDVVTIQ